MVKVWYPMNKDRDFDVNFKFIHLINNGLDYITPGIDSNVKLVKTKFAELTGNIQSGMDICEVTWRVAKMSNAKSPLIH